MAPVLSLLVAISVAFASSAFGGQQARNALSPTQVAPPPAGPASTTLPFEIAWPVSCPCTLHVANGAAGSGPLSPTRVLAGSVWVDGVLVLTPLQLSAINANASAPLSLSAGVHTVRVDLLGPVTSFVTVRISGTITAVDLSVARANHTATLMPNGSVIVAGGESASTVLSSTERITATANHVEPAASLLTPRAGQAAALVAGRTIIFSGGRDAAADLSSVEAWTTAGGAVAGLPLDEVRRAHTATTLLDGRVLILGGRNGNGDSLNTGLIIDPRPDAFTDETYSPDAAAVTSLGAVLQVARAGHSATLLADGRLLIVAGRTGAVDLSSIELFDPSTMTSVLLPIALATARTNHTATLRSNGNVVVIGGRNGSTVLSSIERIQPALDAVASSGTIGVARAGHTATVIRNGEILIAGGTTSSGPTANTELGPRPPDDTVPPTIVATLPTANATDVERGVVSGVRASEPLDPDTVNGQSVELRTSAGALVASSVAIVDQGSTIAVRPDALLTSGAYTVSINGVTDRAGLALAPFSFSFTVVPAPLITALVPSAAAAGTEITVTGSGFGDEADDHRLSFGSLLVPVVPVDANTFRFMVPSVPLGSYPVSLRMRGGVANAPASFEVMSAGPPPAAVTIFPRGMSLSIGGTHQFSAKARFADGTEADITTTASWTSSDSNVLTVNATGLASAVAEGTSTITLSFGGLSVSADVRVYTGEAIPPDPADVAPEAQSAHTTLLSDSTRFLYEGANAIQRDVVPGAIQPLQVSILRGRVLTRDGQPLPGARVTIKDHPEFGYTWSRLDGAFDMAVNAGGSVVVHFSKDTFLPVERRDVVPSGQFFTVSDVVLIGLDPQVTAIDLNSAVPISIARGSVESDFSGSRQVTVLFPQGLTATMVMPDGTTQPLTTLHVRATEYTVGPNGPAAMPATLPPASGYTYAVELNADEALAAGASSLQFSTAVPFYLENFLGFDVGAVVPVGYYDRALAAWVPSENGIVLKVLAIDGSGRAELDLDGDAAADDPAAFPSLGISDAERLALGSTYSAGQELWRATVNHFSTFDLNWPRLLAADADTSANQGAPTNGNTPSNADCNRKNSIIECQDQVLGERLPIAGTAFTLNYRSERAPGRQANRLSIPLTEPTVPASMQHVELHVEVAGRRFVQTFPPTGGQVAEFTWDGLDAYGRLVDGVQAAHVEIRHLYPFFYPSRSYLNTLLQTSSVFGLPRTAAGLPQSELIPARTLDPVVVKWTVPIGPPPPSSRPIAGWSIDVHHAYLFESRTLMLGDGTQKPNAAGGISPVNVETSEFFHRHVAANGAIYFTDNTPAGGVAVYRAVPDLGTIEVGPVPFPVHFAVDGSGVVYYADCEVPDRVSVYRMRPGVSASLVAESDLPVFEECDGVFIALAQDGTIFVDTSTEVFQKLPDGPLVPIGGINVASSLAVGPDLSVYRGVQVPSTPTTSGTAVERIDATGAITIIAGGKRNGNVTGGGGPAADASFGGILDLAVANDGSVLVASQLSGVYRLQQVTPYGQLFTIAGGVASPPCCLPRPPAILLPEGTSAQSVPDFDQIEAGDDGWVYLIGSFIYKFRPLPGPTRVAAEDGGEIYEFDRSGRHTRTLDALTGATRYAFTFDPAGELTAITDGDGLTTEIERDGTGTPTAIVAPFGQTTSLTVDEHGWLASIVAPGSRTTLLTSAPSGLLTDLIDPNGHPHAFTYDDDGRLILDENPADGSETLVRTALPGGGWDVTNTTAMGRVRRYRTEIAPATGAQVLTITEADGTTSTQTSFPNRSSESLSPDGMRTSITMIPDPRFGTHAPIPQTVTLRSPAGRVMTTTRSRTVTLPDSNNLSTLVQTDETRVNNRLWRTVFTGSTRTFHTTSPVGRVTTSSIDAQGRVTRTQVGTLTPIDFTYDAEGRLTTTTQGPRVSTIDYDASGRPSVLTDALTRTVEFGYDAADRVTTQTLPDTRAISFDYDQNDNVTTLTPPGRPAHTFTYTPIDLTSSYTPPAVAGAGPTGYVFNADKQPTELQRPDGQAITFAYGATNGRLNSVTFSRGSLSYGYDAVGRVSALSDPGGVTLTYTYDGALPLRETWLGAVSGSVSRTFDNDFGVATEQVNNTLNVAFTYDADRLLTGAGALTIARHPQNGLVTSTTLGTSTDSYGYNEFGEPSRQTSVASAVQVFDVQISRDDLGRITQRIEVVDGITRVFQYGYDLAGRLEVVTRDGTLVSRYTYDVNGNRLTAEGEAHGGGLPIAATYDDQDRLLTYGGATYTYTANGEVRSKSISGQTTSYVYDTLGNLIQVTLPNGTVITYTIDGRGRRVGKSINGVRVKGWLYADQLRPVAELDGFGNVVSRFIYGDKGNVPAYMVRGGATYRIFSDHVGSPRIVVNTTTGQTVQRMDFHAFGEVIQDTSPGWQPFGFAGGLHDSDTALTRFGARDYDPLSARWHLRDQVGFAAGDPNLYAYANSDPLNNIDPTGFEVFPRGVPIMNVKPSWIEAAVIAAPAVAAGAVVGAEAAALLLGRTICLLGGGAAAALPTVPSAVDKLQKIGMTIQQATQFVRNPASQQFVDKLNNNNINVVNQVGDKLVRITLDPTGQRIISAGYMQANGLANGIASGRFVAK